VKPAAALAAGLLLLAFAAPSRAARPLDTEDTGTLDPGKFELELGGAFSRNPDDKAWSLRAVLAAGLLSRLEVRFELPVLFLEPDDGKSRAGLSDSIIGAKYRLLDEDSAGLALLGSVILRLPSGDSDRGLGTEGVDVMALGAVSKTVGLLILTGNAGYTFVTDDRDLDFWALAASGEYRLTNALSLVAEVVGLLSAHHEPDIAFVRGGATYAIRDNIRLDAAVGYGLTHQSPDLLVTVGVTIGF
jgi:hypothetical protein